MNPAIYTLDIIAFFLMRGKTKKEGNLHFSGKAVYKTFHF